MPSRRILHVTPVEGSREWKVAPRGSGGRTFPRKSEAVSFARKEARSTALGQVVVHRRDGRIQQEFTYGKDPRRYPG